MRNCTFSCQELGSVSAVNNKANHVSLTLNLARLDVVANSLGAPSINLAASAESSSQNLEDSSPKLLGERLLPHLSGNLDDLIQRNRLGVLDVLFLLTVTRRLLEGLDDERGRRWDDGDSGLTVLDGKADCDAETFL